MTGIIEVKCANQTQNYFVMMRYLVATNTVIFQTQQQLVSLKLVLPLTTTNLNVTWEDQRLVVTISTPEQQVIVRDTVGYLASHLLVAIMAQRTQKI